MRMRYTFIAGILCAASRPRLLGPKTGLCRGCPEDIRRPSQDPGDRPGRLGHGLKTREEDGLERSASSGTLDNEHPPAYVTTRRKAAGPSRHHLPAWQQRQQGIECTRKSRSGSDQRQRENHYTLAAERPGSSRGAATRPWRSPRRLDNRSPSTEDQAKDLLTRGRISRERRFTRSGRPSRIFSSEGRGLRGRSAPAGSPSGGIPSLNTWPVDLGSRRQRPSAEASWSP